MFRNCEIDRDILVITKEQLKTSELKKESPESPFRERLSFSAYTSSYFSIMFKKGALFVHHILAEAKIIYDDGFFEYLKSTPFHYSVDDCKSELRIVKSLVNLYEDPTCFNELYGSAYSRLSVLFGRVTILGVALRDKPIFDKRKALIAFVRLYPEIKEDVSHLKKLAPFVLAKKRNKEIKLPFSPVGSRDRFVWNVLRLEKVINHIEETR
jgi:hypothetical protein